MTPDQAHLFSDFFDQVRRRMKLIRENGHRAAPLNIEGYRDVELEDAYDAIRPWLIRISKHQLYAGVASLPEYQGPFVAENALHALSIQFNPPESMYGNPALLESDAIKHMLHQAEFVYSQLAEMPTIPVAIPVLPLCGSDIWEPEFVQRWKLPETANQLTPITAVEEKSRGKRRTVAAKSPLVPRSRENSLSLRSRARRGPNGEWSEDMIELHALLMAHHKVACSDHITKSAGVQGVIAAMLSKKGRYWSKSRVSRTMQELFAGNRGYGGTEIMAWYRKLCDSPRIIDELLRQDLQPLASRLKVHGVGRIIDCFEDRNRSTVTDAE